MGQTLPSQSWGILEACSEVPGAPERRRPDAPIGNPQAGEHPLTTFREAEGLLRNRAV